MSGGRARIHSGCVLALYLLLALAIFSPLGATGRLAGNCDSWLAIALSNTYAATLASWLSGSSIGTALYPWGMPFAYGESSPLGALLFGLFKLVGLGDVGAYTASPSPAGVAEGKAVPRNRKRTSLAGSPQIVTI